MDMLKHPLTRYLFIILLMIPGLAAAQTPRTGTLSGKVQDASGKGPLEAVTIAAVLLRDSVLINYVSTRADGRYRLTGLPLNKPLEVFVTRKGYRDTFAVFTLTTEKPAIDSLNWLISVQPIALKGVSVVASRAPFTYRNDTLEFNATAYKVKPNGTVRDLLRGLPGVEVDDGGQITVYGKKVDRVQLEGDEFYAGNMDMAVENLPADIIDKVQVTTTQTELDKMTPGPKKKSKYLTINLTLKKNKKQGVLGKLGAGMGTEGRYAGDLSSNRLGGKIRLSAYANAGNVPRNNNMNDRGLTDNQALGFNAAGKPGKKISVDLNYSAGRTSSYATAITERTNFLPDSSFTNHSGYTSRWTSLGHNISSRLSYQADSLTNWYFTLSASFRNGNSSAVRSSEAVSEDGLRINAMDGSQADKEASQGVTGSVSYRRQTRNKKAAISAQYSGSLNFAKTDGRQYSLNTFLKAPADTIDQRSENDNFSHGQGLSMDVTYSPLNRVSVSGGYQLSYSVSHQQRETLNAGDKGYTERDTVLSANNKMDNYSHQPHLSLAYRNDKVSVTLNGGWSFTEQRSRFLWRDSAVVVKQQQFSPSVNADYTFEGGSLSSSYSLSTSEPSSNQLSPIVDNRNPLAIVIGNPALRNTLTHTSSFSVSLFRPNTGLGGTLSLDAGMSQNQVVQDVSYDTLRRQVTRFRNTNGIHTVQMSASIAQSKKKGKWMVRTGFFGNAAHGQDVSFLDGKRNEAVRWSTNGGFRGGFSNPEVLNFSTGLSCSWSNSVNSLEGLNNVHTLSVHYSSVADIHFIKKMFASVNYNYTVNTQLPEDMGRRMHRAGASVERRFLPKENLTLSLSVTDLFNNRMDVSRTITSSYVENRTTNTLGRCLLLRLQWNFDALHEQRDTRF